MAKYFNTEQAAAYIEKKYGIVIRPATMNGWRKNKKGPHYQKLVGKVLYEKEGLDFFIQSAQRISTMDSEQVEFSDPEDQQFSRDLLLERKSDGHIKNATRRD